MKQVDLLGIQVEPTTGSPVLVLGEHDGLHRILPLFVGAPEAASIALALTGAEPPRPLTHDLLVDLIGRLGAEVLRVEVTALHDSTFLADLVLGRAGSELRVDARPSDAIAVALRARAPLYVSDDVLDRAGAEVAVEPDDDLPEALSSPPPPDPSPVDPATIEHEVDDFRRFLDRVRPDDFGRTPHESRGSDEFDESGRSDASDHADIDVALIDELSAPDDDDNHCG